MIIAKDSAKWGKRLFDCSKFLCGALMCGILVYMCVAPIIGRWSKVDIHGFGIFAWFLVALLVPVICILVFMAIFGIWLFLGMAFRCLRGTYQLPPYDS